MDDGWGNMEKKPKRGWFKKKPKPQPMEPAPVREVIEKVVDEAPKQTICPLIAQYEQKIEELKAAVEDAKRMTLIYKEDRDKLKAAMDKAVLELKGA